MERNKNKMNNIDLIAEIAGGHEGKEHFAIQLINIAKNSEATSIKFQIYVADELCDINHIDYETFKNLEFREKNWKNINKIIRSTHLNFYVDIFGEKSLDIANSLKIDGIKIHASDLGNLNLIKKAGELVNKIFLGTGGRKRIEIFEAVNVLKKSKYAGEIILVAGHQLFPTPPDQHSLLEISHLKNSYKDFNVNVCVADHFDGDIDGSISFPIAAVGNGAKYVEKHITIDRNLKLEDYESALNPDNFKKLSRYLFALDKTFSNFPEWSHSRQIYRDKMIKRPIAIENISPGEKISRNKINYLRTLSNYNPVSDEFLSDNVVIKNIFHEEEIKLEHYKPKLGLLINARMASKRLKGKALLEFKGYSSLEILINRMKKVKQVDTIILCTTNENQDNVLEGLALKNNIKVFRGSSLNIAKRLCDACLEHKLDHFVRVTGDDLLRDIDLIDLAINRHIENNSDYTYLSGSMIGLDSEIISKRAIKCIKERAQNPLGTEYLSWYLNDDSLLNINKIEVDNIYKGPFRFSLDTIEDYNFFNLIFQNFDPMKNINIYDLIKFLNQKNKVTKLWNENNFKNKNLIINTKINV